MRFPEFMSEWLRMQELEIPAHHIRMAEWLEEVWRSEDRRGLLLAFRGSGKSTVAGLFLAWLLYVDPNLRILVVAADTALAKKMVRSVKRIIETHPDLECIRPLRKEEWRSGSFIVERSAALRDPSVMAVGLDCNVTGSRADVIVCDDVEVPKNSDSRQKRLELREKLLELSFVLVPDGMQVYIGTPHTWDTIYKT
jgi:hypothetical protein